MVGSERDVMGGPLPGGGRYRLLIEGDFEPRQIRALVRMLELTAENLADEGPVEREPDATPSDPERPDGRR